MKGDIPNDSHFKREHQLRIDPASQDATVDVFGKVSPFQEGGPERLISHGFRILMYFSALLLSFFFEDENSECAVFVGLSAAAG